MSQKLEQKLSYYRNKQRVTSHLPESISL